MPLELFSVRNTADLSRWMIPLMRGMYVCLSVCLSVYISVYVSAVIQYLSRNMTDIQLSQQQQQRQRLQQSATAMFQMSSSSRTSLNARPTPPVCCSS